MSAERRDVFCGLPMQKQCCSFHALPLNKSVRWTLWRSDSVSVNLDFERRAKERTKLSERASDNYHLWKRIFTQLWEKCRQEWYYQCATVASCILSVRQLRFQSFPSFLLFFLFQISPERRSHSWFSVFTCVLHRFGFPPCGLYCTTQVHTPQRAEFWLSRNQKKKRESQAQKLDQKWSPYI